MKRFIIISLIALLSSCEGLDIFKFESVETGKAIIIGSCGATILSYLTMDSSKTETCQFGVLYSTDPNPSTANGVFVQSGEVQFNLQFETALGNLSPDTEYYYKAYFKTESGEYGYGRVKSFKTRDTSYDTTLRMVDLGLSVKWASFNLGATRQEDYGYYYQWASATPIESEVLSSAPYLEGPLFPIFDRNWTKYNSTGEQIELDSCDDAAFMNLGSNWRMPTADEWYELMDNCTWTRTENFNGTGVSGNVVFSRKKGYEDRFIFLPAAGCHQIDFISDEGLHGYYWSSSIDALDFALAIGFSGSGSPYKLRGSRCLGYTVRAVSEAK